MAKNDGLERDMQAVIKAIQGIVEVFQGITDRLRDSFVPAMVELYKELEEAGVNFEGLIAEFRASGEAMKTVNDDD